jgi:threonine efflux protein
MYILAHIDSLLMVYAAYILATASPGPSNMTIMATSVEHGRRAGLALAAGVLAGSFTWAILAAFGVASLIAAYASLLIGIKAVGGGYLIYLGLRFGRSAFRPGDLQLVDSGTRTVRLWRLFARGYLLHLTNPKAILSWTAIIVLGMKPETPPEMVGAVLVGCLCLGFLVFGSYAVLFSSRTAFGMYSKIRRGAEAVLAGFFVFAGFKLLTQKF